MKEKLDLLAKIFTDPVQEVVEGVDNTPLQHGRYYGGIYNGHKYLYSYLMIEKMPIEKLETFIRKQIT